MTREHREAARCLFPCGLAVVALAKVAETYHRNQTVLVDTLAAVA